MIFRASLLGNVFEDLERGKRLWIALSLECRDLSRSSGVI